MGNESFEQKVERIKMALNALGAPDLSLKDGMDLYKEALSDLKEAQEMLERAKNEFEEIKNKDKE